MDGVYLSAQTDSLLAFTGFLLILLFNVKIVHFCQVVDVYILVISNYGKEVVALTDLILGDFLFLFSFGAQFEEGDRLRLESFGTLDEELFKSDLVYLRMDLCGFIQTIQLLLLIGIIFILFEFLVSLAYGVENVGLMEVKRE